MAEVKISAELRTEFGKGAARRTRRDKKIPGVLYGHGNDVRHISLPDHELMRALRTANVLLNIDLDGTSELAIPKDIQRDKVRGSLEHVDLLVVRRGEKVKVDVAVHLVGNAVADSLVNQEMNTIEVMAEATHIPTAFEVDISGLTIGTQILAKDIALPTGVELVTEGDHLVVNITTQSVAEPEPEAAEAPAAGAEAAAPAAEAAE